MSTIQAMNGPLDPPRRILMGPGPSDVHPRVLRALSAPTVGHLDPYFLRLMDQTKSRLQQVFQSENEITFAVSGTGSAGMECCMVNVLEPGDHVVIGRNGVFGGRMAEIAQRLNCEVTLIDSHFGEPVDEAKVIAALRKKKTKLVAAVHAETSTGVCTDLRAMIAASHEEGALFLADCVTSLGGMPVTLDEWGVDLAYSGTQKCLSCPPGLAPVSFSVRAADVMRRRKTPVVSWYLDLGLLLRYWEGAERAYHHTAPINMVYGLNEALAIVLEEGLPAVFARHQLHHRALAAGLEAMELKLLVPPSYRLPQLNAVCIPEGVDDKQTRRALLDRYGIEIGGGLGSLAGKVWRIGLMGHACRKDNVLIFLAALDTILGEQGYNFASGSGVRAATQVYREAALPATD